MKKTFSGILVAALAFAGVVGTSTKADAAFMAYICDDAACSGGGDFVATDGTDTGLGAGVPGFIALSGSTGGFDVVVNLAQSKPGIGSAGAPQLDINFLVRSSDNVDHTVFLYAQDTGFTGTGTATFTAGGTQNPVGGNTSIIGRAWAGTTNTNTADPRAVGPLFLSTPLATQNPFGGSVSGLLSPGLNPYAITIGIQITRSTAGTTTGDLNLAVPEPASMALFGLGLMGASLASRRRKAAQAK